MGSSISPKVVASTVASAIVLVVCFIAGQAGVDVPVEVQAALTVIVVFVAGYLKIDPDRA